MFDLETFLATTVNAAMSTRMPNIPEGEYVGMVRESKHLSARKISTKDGEKIVLDLQWGTDDPQAQQATKLPWPTARQSIFLDLDESGSILLGEGDNTQLGRLREALRQNDASKPWSFHMIVGASARFTVKHKVGDDGTIYANVTKVAPLYGG